MCVVSMVLDHYRDDRWKHWTGQGSATNITWPPQVTREEFDELKRDVANMLALLKRAKIYDAATNQPDCEMAEKLAFVRKVAEFVGVDLDAALKSAPTPST